MILHTASISSTAQPPKGASQQGCSEALSRCTPLYLLN